MRNALSIRCFHFTALSLNYFSYLRANNYKVFHMGKQNAIQSFFTNDRMMLVLVLVNTIAIFVGGFFEASTFFIWSDSFFTILFVIEAIVKISTYGWKDYWKDGWNRFDFILTVVAIPSLMNSFLDFDLATK